MCPEGGDNHTLMLLIHQRRRRGESVCECVSAEKESVCEQTSVSSGFQLQFFMTAQVSSDRKQRHLEEEEHEEEEKEEVCVCD